MTIYWLKIDITVFRRFSFCLQLITPKFPVVVKVGHANGGYGKVRKVFFFLKCCHNSSNLDKLDNFSSSRISQSKSFNHVPPVCETVCLPDKSLNLWAPVLRVTDPFQIMTPPKISQCFFICFFLDCFD